jgi:hypothetical protein
MLEEIDWRSIVFIVDGIFFLSLALVFALRIPLATDLWPWMEQPICSFFFSSLLAAYGAGCIFLVRLKDWSASAGGSIALLVAFGGFALQITAAEIAGHDTGLRISAMVLAVIAVIAGVTLILNLKLTPGSRSLAPTSLRRTLGLMAGALYLVGLALLAGAHAILPWSLTPQTRALLAWTLIGFSANYAYTSLQGGGAAASILLAGLLTYDLAIIVPLLRHFYSVAPDYRLTLELNLAAILLTATIAVFFLFIRHTPLKAGVVA